MTIREKQKIADDYFRITQNLIEKHGRSALKPNYFEIVVSRILDLFPVDGAEISMHLRDRLVAELNFTI